MCAATARLRLVLGPGASAVALTSQNNKRMQDEERGTEIAQLKSDVGNTKLEKKEDANNAKLTRAGARLTA